MDRQQMERCLEKVAAYRASGQRAKEWAEVNGIAMRSLASWCAHARRWQDRLEGVSAAPAPTPRASGFVAARVAPGTKPGTTPGTASASLRVELSAGSTRLDLHWPLAHTRELAALLRELGQ
jgi:hypothetical protein